MIHRWALSRNLRPRRWRESLVGLALCQEDHWKREGPCKSCSYFDTYSAWLNFDYYSIGLNSLAKRMSCQSLQSMIIDGETPIKSGSGMSTPNTEARRRIATSKSMHNLKSSGGSRHESPTSRAFPSSLAQNRMHYASQQGTPSNGAAPPTRPASSSALEGPSSATRRSESSASIANHASSVADRISPSKRMTIARTSTAPPQLSSAASMNSLASYATLAPNGLPAPRWNMEDEDTLPSPFIKKKISTGPLRAIAMAHAQQQHQPATISGGTMHRAYSSNSISNSAQGKDPNGSRVTRAATARQSLAGRLAMHRQAKVDEQGRRTAA